MSRAISDKTVIDSASPIIDSIEALFNKALSNVKQTIDAGAGSFSDGLDDAQVVSYELAMIGAELYAARSIVDYAGKCEGEHEMLEHDMAGVFVADTIGKIRWRMDKIRYAAGLAGEDLLPVFESPTTIEFCRTYLAPERLQETGALILIRNSHGRSLLSEDKQIIASSFARVSNEVVAPRAEEIHREDLTIPQEILDAIIEMGCFALSIPERFGGTAPESGHDHLAMVVVTEELSRGSLAAAGSPLTRPEIVSRAIMAGGDEGQKERWLPGIAQGDPLCAVAVTEPDYGSDVAAVRLKATRTSDGWLLDGSKTWCTFAGKAGLVLVLARTDPDPSAGHKGLSLFLFEKPSTDDKEFSFTQAGGGALSGTAIPTIGYRGMHSFTLFFDNFFVPQENLIGGQAGEGQGFYQTMKAFAGGRLQTAARACGVMRAAFSEATRYAKERSVFGKLLSEYQLTQAKIAQMGASLRACREMTYNVARLMDEGKGQMEASLVKLYACRAAEFLTREAVQIHGGMGYSEETPVSRYFVDARVLSIFEGAEETLALKVVAKDLIANAKTL